MAKGIKEGLEEGKKEWLEKGLAEGEHEKAKIAPFHYAMLTR